MDKVKLASELVCLARELLAARGVPLSVFDVETADGFIKEIERGIKVPFFKGYKSTLGGDKNVAIMFTAGMDDKSDWPNGILENSRYGKFHLDNDGVLELHSGGFKLPKKFRKTVVRDAKDLIRKVNRWVDQNKTANVLANH
jgi:hypothetical protein